MNEYPVQDRGASTATYSAFLTSSAIPSLVDTASYKKLMKPQKPYSTKDFMIIKEVLQHAYQQYQNDFKKNPNIKLDQIRLLSSYEYILKQYGIDPLTDGFFYRILMKIEHSKLDLFSALEKEIHKANSIKLANSHYEKCLQAKSFFTLVQNMVNSKCFDQQKSEEKSQKKNQTQKVKSKKLSSDKENIQKNQSKKDKVTSKKQPLNYIKHQENECFKLSSNRTQQASSKVLKRSNTSRLSSQSKRVSAKSRDYNKPTIQLDTATNPFQQNTFFTSENIELTSNNTILKLDQTLSSFTFPKNHQHMNQMREGGGFNQSLNQSASQLKMQDYKLLLKCMRTWKHEIHQKKLKRVDDERALENWALSIHFHEQTLLTKSFLCLQRSCQDKKIRDFNERRTNVMGEVRLRKRYFKKWLRTYQGHSKRREHIFKALNHWGSSMSKKVINKWSRYIELKKKWQHQQIRRLAKRPIALVCLLMLKLKTSEIKNLQQHIPQFIRNKQTLSIIINEINLLKLKQVFKQLKTDTQRDKDMIKRTSQNHLRYIFRKLRSNLRKSSMLKRNHEKLMQEQKTKIIWSFFANWLNATTEKLIKRDKFQKSIFHSERSLQYKAFRSLLIHLNSRQFAHSQLKKSVHSSLNRVIQKAFQGWKFTSFYNRKYRMLSTKARLIHNKGIKSHYFMQWIKTAILVCKAKMNYEKQLKQKLMQALLDYMEIKENKDQTVKCSIGYHQQRQQKIVLKQWIKFTKKTQNERTLKRTVFKFVNQRKQRLVVASWREVSLKMKETNQKIAQIQQKHSIRMHALTYKAINQNRLKSISIKTNSKLLSDLTTQRQTKKALGLWMHLLNKKIELREKQHYLRIVHIKQMLVHYFSQWAVQSFSKNERRAHFFRNRASNIIQKAFKSLVTYSSERSKFRKRLHQFLKLRAYNLTVTAYNRIREYTRANEVQRKMQKVAAFVFLQNILKKCFTSFKTMLILRQSKVRVQSKVQRRLAHKSLQQWKFKFLRADILKRMSIRHQTLVKYACMTQWRAFISKNKQQHQRMIKGLQRYGSRLLIQSIVGLKHNVDKKRASKLRQFKYYHQYIYNVARKCIYYWQVYSDVQSKQKGLINAILEKNRLQALSLAFGGLKYSASELKYYRGVVEPYAYNKQRKIQRQCLVGLYKYAFQRSIIRANFQRYNQNKNHEYKLAIFDGLYRYKQYKQSFNHLKTKAFQFLKFSLSRKIFYAFMKNRLVSTYTKDVMKQRNKNLIFKHLQKWIISFNEVQQVKPMIGIADLYQKKRIFDHFVAQVKMQKRKRQSVISYSQKAIDYNRKQSQTTGVRQLYQYSQQRKLRKMKISLADKIFMKKVYSKWRHNLKEIKRDKAQYCLYSNFRRFHLLQKGFNLLAQTVQAQQQKYIRFQMHMCNKQLEIYKKCMIQLFENAKSEKVKKNMLSQKLQVLDRVQIRPMFNAWKENVTEISKNMKARAFRIARGSKYILRKHFDKLRIRTLIEKDIKNKVSLIRQQRELRIKDQLFTCMVSLKRKSIVINKKFETIMLKKAKSQLSQYFQAFYNQVQVLKITNHNNRNARIFLGTCLAKKTFIGLQKHQIQNQISLMMKKRINQRLIIQMFEQWRLSFVRSIGLNKIIEVLQENQTEKLKQQFFQRLVKLSFYQQIYESMQSKRLQRHAATFINLLKRDMIYSQIVYGFRYARSISYKKKGFIAFLANKEEKMQHRTIIETQVYTVIEESNTELLRLVFSKLKLYYQREKMKKTASGLYIQNIQKKALFSIKFVTGEQRSDFIATTQIRFIQTQRYLNNWIEALLKKQQAKQVAKLMQFNQMRNIVIEWRNYCIKMNAAKEFQLNQLKQRTFPLAFSALVLYNQREKYLKHCHNEIYQNRSFSLMKEVMLNWMDYNSLQKISGNLEKFHSFKLLKQVSDEWRQIAQRGIKKRRIIMHMRQVIESKPYIIKPILVIRNVLLFKAFQNLRIGTHISSKEISQRTNSSYAFYLRLVRKAFYSLTLNVQQRQQRKKVRMLRNLFIMRRWFIMLRQAGQKRKQDRKMRTESAIFNFLNLQRKAFAKLLQYASSKQQDRIKRQFSEELYYKRLADKAFIGLKMSLEESRKQNSMVQKNNLTYFSSKFDQDVSNLQLECSAVMDFEEKKRLVAELYNKKMLFKCFAGWANQALCISEDEDSNTEDDEIASVSLNEQ